MDTETRDILLALGQRLSSIRRDRRLTQDQLAELADVDIQSIRRGETGRSVIPLGRLMKIARVLGVKLADMFAFDTSIPEPTNDPVEARLIAIFRTVPAERRDWAVRMVETLAGTMDADASEIAKD